MPAQQQTTTTTAIHETAVGLATRDDVRNVAIVAHVDHGKTTLVDAMLWQSGAFGAHAHVNERVMDSNDLEREKGITILAKNTAVTARRPDDQHHRHARPRRLRRRGRARPVHGGRRRAAGRRQRGPAPADPVRAPQDARGEPPRHPRHQQGRPPRRPHRRGHRRSATSCSSTSTPSEEQIEFPIVYAAARAGRASLNRPEDGGMPDSENLEPLFDVIRETVPAPVYDPEALPAGARHQPRRVRLPGPHRALPDPQRHHPPGPAGRLVQDRRLDRAGEDHRAAPHRGARARARPRPRAPATSSRSPAFPTS